MTIEEAIVARVLAFAGTAALVGDRVFPGFIPAGAAHPAIAYQRIGGPPNYVMLGETGAAEARIQITCWGVKYADAAAVAEQVRLALSGFRGQLGTVMVDSLFLEGPTDTTDQQPGSDQSKKYGRRLELRVRFHQTAASQ